MEASMIVWSTRRPRLVADGFGFLEAPRWHDGRLHVSDFYRRSVFTIDAEGAVTTVCTVAGQPSGLGFSPDGDLLVVSMLDKRLLRLHGGALHTVAELGDLAPGPANDMVVDRHGRAFVGNFGPDDSADGFGPTGLIRVEPGGDVSMAADGLVFPNGAVVTGDADRLIVAETFAHRITEFDLSRDGALSGRRVWADFTAAGRRLSTSRTTPGTPVSPDGMALDDEGGLWIGDAVGGGAVRVGPGGTVLDSVDTGALAVYALALGGHDRRTLYLCAAPPLGVEDPSQTRNSVLLACRVDVPGAGLP